MRKDNRIVKFAIIVLALTMIALILVSGTFAKYTSKTSGQDTATVARWSIKVNNTQIAIQPETTVTFDLFGTIKDTGETANETDVKSGKLIAPGTSGSFALKIDNLSEVNAKYSIAYTVTNTSNIPIQYSVDGTTWKTDLTQLNVTDKAIAMESGTETVTVHWKWEYEADRDAADTALGIAAQTSAPTITVKAEISATQVD